MKKVQFLTFLAHPV